jgi:putative transposase
MVLLTELAEAHIRWGFKKMMAKIKILNKGWNHKRVYRVYCELKLNLRIKPRKRIPSGDPKVLMQPIKANVCWSMDFMSDALTSGLRFRTLNVIDDYNRRALLVYPDFSISSEKVTACLDRVALRHGYPDMIRVDNGPEFIASNIRLWAKRKGITLIHIQPGKPAQNGYIERFNRTYRDDILSMYLFDNLDEVKLVTKPWIEFYNNERPHESLDNLAPTNFAVTRDLFSNNNAKEGLMIY